MKARDAIRKIQAKVPFIWREYTEHFTRWSSLPAEEVLKQLDSWYSQVVEELEVDYNVPPSNEDYWLLDFLLEVRFQ